MKRILMGLACIMLLFSACKKNETNTTVAEAPLTMTIGVYSGKYVENGIGASLVTNYQYRANVSMVNDSTYNVSPISAGNLPVFNMIASLRTVSGSRTIMKFRIPHQDGGNGNDIVGDARQAGGYDGIWNSTEKTFAFGIVYNSDPNTYIRFTSIKE